MSTTVLSRLYRVCMNKSLIEKQGLEPLHRILKDLGGWPVLMGHQWVEDDFNWKESVYRFHKIGYSHDYFGFNVRDDLKNSTKRVVDISVPDEELRNATALYNPMTVNQLQKKFPSIPWLEFINALLEPSASVTEDEIVIVNVPGYIASLEKLLEQTPKRVQANYLMWRAVEGSVSYLNDEARESQLAYLSVSEGRKTREPRWKECVDIVSSSFPISVGSIYVRKYFNDDAKKSAVEMISNISEEFKKILLTIDWMDPKTREAALGKAESMSMHVGYPDELLDDIKLEQLYTNLELTPGNYLQSILNVKRFDTERQFERLRKPVEKNDWITHGNAAIVDARYYYSKNSIEVTAAILQGAFFDRDRPRYMNYGTIGIGMGHEITHGFDDEGRQLDKEGNLMDWWLDKTKENYLSRVECIIHQYGNYTASDVKLNLNGINTQGENIADNGGMKVAYRAYNEWVRRNKPEQSLPGLNYTPQQMFWISSANAFCTKYRPEHLEHVVNTNTHSPAEFRVNGPLSNMPEFANDFNCPVGSPMNPENKCTVW